LDSVVADERRAEARRQRELQSQLDEFRRLQSEADRPSGSVTENSSNTAEEGKADAEFGGWKKRKRKESAHAAATTAKTGLGLKVRRTSSGAERVETPNSKKEKGEGKGSVDEAGSVEPKQPVQPLAKKPTLPEKKAQPKGAVGGLGLVEYGSDDDDD